MTTIPDLPTTRECPYRPAAATEQLSDEGPVSQVRLPDGRLAWYVSGHAEARALLSDARLSSDRTRPEFPRPIAVPPELREQRARHDSPFNTAALIATDPPEHTRQRRMVIPQFAVRRIAALRPRIHRIVDDRIDQMMQHGPVADLVLSFALPIPSMVICELLGVPYADHEFFEEQAQLRLDPERGVAAMTALQDYLDKLLHRKLDEPGDGLLDDLLDEQRADSGAADLAELVSFALVLLIAGHDTTANVIALGTFALLEHPDQLAALRADPGLIPAAVEELLRYVSLVPALPRVALQDIAISGRRIHAGDGILIGLAAANHDAGFVEHPGELDVRRTSRHHLGFGFGVHQCLGQNLARTELEIAFATLLSRIPTLRLAVPADRIEAKPGFLPGVSTLPVTW